MAKNWKLKPNIPAEIREQLKAYPDIVAQLLYNRDILSHEAAEAFLNVSYEQQYSPFLFKDMQKAVDRIWQAIESGESIWIYGDYDADAVTASAVLTQALLHLGVKTQSYIPDRFTEGYGINLEALSRIKDQGSRVIITVDCGTNSVDAAEFCKENGIDLIITDHHEIIGELPDAYALINPKNPGDNYPYRDITGVGVAFKLASALLQDPKTKNQNPTLVPGYEKWLLDLVAIGTVADCHALLGENRILVKYGLKVLQKTKWPGLRAILESAGIDQLLKPADTYTLGFVIAPRLNAAGRLEHAARALETLLATNKEDASRFAENLEQINLRRQQQTLRIVSEAKDQAHALGERNILVVAGTDWNKGIVGLVAGRLAEEFHKPVFALQKGEFESTGSARTAGEFNVVDALKYASSHLVRFGGHQQAAGLTLKTSELDVFYQKLLEYAEKYLKPEDLDPALMLEAELLPLDFAHISPKLFESLEPFGVGNPRPKFLIRQAEINSLRFVGAQNQHMQLGIMFGESSLPAVYFNYKDFAKNLKIGDTIDMAAELMEDTWNGRSTIKAKIVDIRLAISNP